MESRTQETKLFRPIWLMPPCSVYIVCIKCPAHVFNAGDGREAFLELTVVEPSH